MDYTSIHIYGHLLSDDILHEIETESSMQGNREQDFNLDVSLTAKIDNAWSSLRNVNPEKPDVPLNKNDAFQKVQKRHVQEKR